MCKPISGYVFDASPRPTVYVHGETDSHSHLAEVFRLRGTAMHGSRLFAFELCPDLVVSPDLGTWILSWDSDATVGCRDKPDADRIPDMRQAIERSCAKFVRVGGEWDSSDRAWYFVGAVVRGISGGEQWLYDASQCHQPSGGVQMLYDQSQCYQPSGGVQELHDQSQCYQPSGGVQWLRDRSQCHQPSGGVQMLYGESQCHPPSAGMQWLHGHN